MTADLPYEAVSPNGRAAEWKAPLWEAIHEYCELRRNGATMAGMGVVARIEQAVETAMRLAIEEHERSPDTARALEDCIAHLMRSGDRFYFAGQPFRFRPDIIAAWSRDLATGITEARSGI